MKTAQLSLNTFHNQKLKGMLLTPDMHKDNYPAVLFLHGWMSDMQGYVPRAAALANIGYICLIFDLRGHDGSDGGIVNLFGEIKSFSEKKRMGSNKAKDWRRMVVHYAAVFISVTFLYTWNRSCIRARYSAARKCCRLGRT